jgi:hypothetical protein
MDSIHCGIEPGCKASYSPNHTIMACKFSIAIRDGWHTVAGDAIRSAGGTFTGNANRGEFSGAIPGMGILRGSYVCSPVSIDITITDKPFLIPCSMIEKYVREKFAAAGG